MRDVAALPKRVLYTRADGKWTWRLEADNDGILAADGGSGYEKEADARLMADRIIGGEFSDAHRTIVRPPKTIDQRFVENIADGLYVQASARAITASEGLHVPLAEVPPGLGEAERQLWGEWWAEHHPESPRTPDLLGPLTVPINFSGPTPAGGWVQLVIRRDGSWIFSGGLRNFGLPSYDDAVVFVLRNLGADESYQFTHRGRVRGTLEAGSHDDYWSESGNNSELADDWDALFIDGHHWQCRVGINVDINSLSDAAQKAVGVAATVISIV
jgi:hypothetical protein